MDAIITITVADFDHLTLLFKAVSAHADAFTLTIQSTSSTGDSVRERPPRPVQFGLTPMEWQMIEFRAGCCAAPYCRAAQPRVQ
jgi:hypothetical protein